MARRASALRPSAFLIAGLAKVLLPAHQHFFLTFVRGIASYGARRHRVRLILLVKEHPGSEGLHHTTLQSMYTCFHSEINVGLRDQHTTLGGYS
jgi:hypothetical protein